MKYCDHCKWDAMTGSKAIPDGVDEADLQACPACDSLLYDADSFEDIP